MKTIKLTIINSTKSINYPELGCWYKNKIGKKIKFFNKIFLDDEKIPSIWKATAPTKKYVYLKDTNYETYIRYKKLKKINSLN